MFAAFLVIGFIAAPTVENPLGIDTELESLDGIYQISPWTLLPLALLVLLSIRKVPASLALAFSAIFAAILAPILQPEVVRNFAGDTGNIALDEVRAAWIAMANGFSIDTGLREIDQLVSRGGMDSMLLTVWLIIGAVTFGEILEKFGLISRLVDPLIHRAKGTGRLYLTVFGCAFGLNIVAGDQYIALVLPSKVFRAEFESRGLAPQMLSRLTADSGTVTSPLVPWNSCGAFMAAVLGVPTLAYLPCCFFNILSPILSVLYGFTGFKIERVTPGSATTTPEIPETPQAIDEDGR